MLSLKREQSDVYVSSAQKQFYSPGPRNGAVRRRASRVVARETGATRDTPLRSRQGHAPSGPRPRPGTPLPARARFSTPRLGLPALLPDATLGLLAPADVGTAATLPR